MTDASRHAGMEWHGMYLSCQLTWPQLFSDNSNSGCGVTAYCTWLGVSMSVPWVQFW